MSLHEQMEHCNKVVYVQTHLPHDVECSLSTAGARCNHRAFWQLGGITAARAGLCKSGLLTSAVSQVHCFNVGQTSEQTLGGQHCMAYTPDRTNAVYILTLAVLRRHMAARHYSLTFTTELQPAGDLSDLYTGTSHRMSHASQLNLILYYRCSH